jgi:hypothetical protein
MQKSATVLEVPFEHLIEYYKEEINSIFSIRAQPSVRHLPQLRALAFDELPLHEIGKAMDYTPNRLDAISKEFQGRYSPAKRKIIENATHVFASENGNMLFVIEHARDYIKNLHSKSSGIH